MAGELITAAYQAELQGVLVGAGTDYPFAKAGMSGFGLPRVRDSDTSRAQGHGVYVGPDYLDSKPLTLALEVSGATAAAIEDLLVDLEAAFAPITDETTIPLVFRLAGTRLYRVNGRPRRFAANLEHLKSARATVVAQFEATDPRIYDNSQSTSAANPGATSGGLGFPHGFPHGFGTSSPGDVTVNNAGNLDTYPTARVTAGVGGISGFAINIAETGESFGVTLSINEGDFIDIDFLERTVLLNGTASRIGNVDRPASTWLSAPPGVSTWGFTVNGAGTATFTVSWRSAYLL